MKLTNRLLALSLSVMLILGTLVSCNLVTPPAVDTRDVNVYTANVEIRFATTDDKMKDAIDGLSSTATILKNGSDVSVQTLSESESASVSSLYVLTSGMLFHTLSVKVGEHEMEENKTAYADETEINKIVSSIGQGATIDKDDFASVNQSDGNYTCSDILDESRASLEGIMAKKLSGIGATAELVSASLDVTCDGEFIISSILSCDYLIDLNGVSYSVTMRLYVDYDYASEVVIGMPENAGEFEPVNIDEILG